MKFRREIKKARPSDLALKVSFKKLVLRRAIGHDIHPVAAFVKGNLAVGEREQGPITARAHVLSRDEFRTALTDQNTAGRHKLTAKSFHAQPLADAITPVTDAALSFFMCHKILNLCVDCFNFDHGQFLTMADALMIAFSAFHLKS